MVVAHTNRGSDLRAPFPVAWLEIDPAEYARLAGELLLKQLHGIPIETRQLELSSRLIVPEEDRTEQEGKALGWSPPVSDNENSVVPSL
jgi:DNA-binding LacI/PurR family transcriptional regulator